MNCGLCKFSVYQFDYSIRAEAHDSLALFSTTLHGLSHKIRKFLTALYRGCIIRANLIKRSRSDELNYD